MTLDIVDILSVVVIIVMSAISLYLLFKPLPDGDVWCKDCEKDMHFHDISNDEIVTKRCKVCGEVKPYTDFPKAGKYRRNQCRECYNKLKRERYHAKKSKHYQPSLPGLE